MRYVLISLAQTAGVLVLACLSILLAHRLSRAGKWGWTLGCIVPLLLAALIAIAGRFPSTQDYPPFHWIMAGRIRCAAMALVCPLLLTTLLFRLQRKRERWALGVLTALFTFCYSVLPFLMPALTYAEFSRLRTTVDQNGVCLQSNGHTCGPAAAVTALRRIGVQAEEGELAVRAYTTRFGGTGADSLCDAIRERYGLSCQLQFFHSVSELEGREPLIAVVKYGFLVDHYVAVLNVSSTYVTIGDPIVGLRTRTREQFEEEWRRCAIVLEKP